VASIKFNFSATNIPATEYATHTHLFRIVFESWF
jgi:hypothetical protein